MHRATTPRSGWGGSWQPRRSAPWQGRTTSFIAPPTPCSLPTPGPSHRVAVRLALVQLASQGAVHMQETLAAARQDAADDPALLATVGLWQAGVAAAAGDPLAALTEADAVIELSQQVGDATTEAMAWS